MGKFGFFRDSELATDCDECGGRVDILKGGACLRCRRILCFTHLHGSFARRLATERYILEEDIEICVADAASRYDEAMKG